MRTRLLRLSALVPPALLAACSEQEVSSEIDRAADSMARFFLTMALIAVFVFVLWALVLAGGVTAILGGIRRLRGEEPPGANPPEAPPATPPQAIQAPPTPKATHAPQGRRRPDKWAIGLIVFGGLLVLGAGPFVFGGGGTAPAPMPVGPGGQPVPVAPPASGVSIAVPLPLLILAVVLVAVGLSRRRRRG